MLKFVLELVVRGGRSVANELGLMTTLRLMPYACPSRDGLRPPRADALHPICPYMGEEEQKRSGRPQRSLGHSRRLVVPAVAGMDLGDWPEW